MAAAVLAGVTVGTERTHHQQASQCTRSQAIVTKANSCLEYIDGMKDRYVSTLVARASCDSLVPG